ncbi:MAG: AmmeMemoRadiSam system protein B, partial [Candidatus Falkowbacteria bacterium]|nr:AmmeMemoRadiSam system protein B [Candidatus Falkowbacteria bacterium]
MKKIFFSFCLLLLLTGCVNNKIDNMALTNSKNKETKNVRGALTAGQFYPADASELKTKINQYLAATTVVATTTADDIGAIMVPHAGYDFSAPVAAYAYKAIAGKQVGTVIIICNSHAAFFPGIAVDNHDAWHTPLGDVAVDKELAKKLVNYDQIIQYNDQPFSASDQTIEVQLPFLQTVLAGDFKILPIYFGNAGSADYKKLAQALAANLGENDLVIASTDMSHYPSYQDANRIDPKTLALVQTADTEKLDEYINEVMSSRIAGEETLLCGEEGVKTVMEIYKLKKWSSIKILKYANSGDVPIGSKDSVVGYGAVIFVKGKTTVSSNLLNAEQQQQLQQIAKTAVETYVRTGQEANFTITDAQLNQPQGAFVTIRKNNELRGCIGQIITTKDPLWQVVRQMAIAAATEDSRFSPVNKDELNSLDYEVSVLSMPQPIDDWQKIELGKQGVIIKSGWHSGVFLPQVATETGWSR